MKHNDRKIAAAYEEWLFSLLPEQSVFVTLTMKQGIKRQDGTWGRLTKEICSRELRWFLRELDRKVFKSAASRFNQRLTRVVYLEGGTSNKQLHAHLIIGLPEPDRVSPAQFVRIIEEIWCGAAWGRKEHDIGPTYYLPGLISYCFKTGPDAIDLDNCYLPEVNKIDGSIQRQLQKHSAKIPTQGTMPVERAKYRVRSLDCSAIAASP